MPPKSSCRSVVYKVITFYRGFTHISTTALNSHAWAVTGHRNRVFCRVYHKGRDLRLLFLVFINYLKGSNISLQCFSFFFFSRTTQVQAYHRQPFIPHPNIALAVRTRFQSFITNRLFIKNVVSDFLKYSIGKWRKWRPTEPSSTCSRMAPVTKNGPYFSIEYSKNSEYQWAFKCYHIWNFIR